MTKKSSSDPVVEVTLEKCCQRQPSKKSRKKSKQRFPFPEYLCPGTFNCKRKENAISRFLKCINKPVAKGKLIKPSARTKQLALPRLR